MIDLCKIFGVEEGEEFRIELSKVYIKDFVYRVKGNKLEWTENKTDFYQTTLLLNDVVNITKVIKLPKKKEFTDDELCILRNIDKEYKWVVRDEGGTIFAFNDKPDKRTHIWHGCMFRHLSVFKHLFQSIQWEDEEPVFIDDYVERGAE